MKVTLPYNWQPREYQKPLWDALARGCRRALPIWHRRAGKDLCAFNWAIVDMLALHPGGQWWHVWPTYEQGRKGFWEGADNAGRRFIDYFPPGTVKRKRDDMMMAELINGSIYRIVGADDPDRLVGANPIGLIMTEYSLQDPSAWDYLRPIVVANDGTVIMPMTPRGRNHAHELYIRAREDPAWFTQILTVGDTGLLSSEVLETERREMGNELFRQEYYCSFNAPLQGAYYADQMDLAEKEGRIAKVPYDAHLGVETWWDIGLRDATAIWFIQRFGDMQIRLIDYMEASGVSLHDWVRRVKDRPYFYHGHVAPHDMGAAEITTGERRIDFARKLGLDFTLASRHKVPEGVDAVRRLLSRCWFDEDRCYRGIEALRSYRKEWDPKKQVYGSNPLHNWASHGADAFRIGTMSRSTKRTKKLPRRANVRYDVFAASRPYTMRG